MQKQYNQSIREDYVNIDLPTVATKNSLYNKDGMIGWELKKDISFDEVFNIPGYINLVVNSRITNNGTINSPSTSIFTIKASFTNNGIITGSGIVLNHSQITNGINGQFLSKITNIGRGSVHFACDNQHLCPSGVSCNITGYCQTNECDASCKDGFYCVDTTDSITLKKSYSCTMPSNNTETNNMVSGQYIRLKYDNTVCLNLAGIAVYADANGDNVITPQTIVTKSSGYQGDTYPVSNFIDGNNNSFVHSSCEDVPWILVDLGMNMPIYKIVVTNRSDCCKDRILGCSLLIFNNQMTSVYESSKITTINTTYTWFPPYTQNNGDYTSNEPPVGSPVPVPISVTPMPVPIPITAGWDEIYDPNTPTKTWSQLKEVCEAKGNRLCNAIEMCPNNQPLSNLNTFNKNDNWVAVGDQQNEWLTYRSDRLCKTHTQVAGSTPTWGSTPQGYNWYRGVKCCPRD